MSPLDSNYRLIPHFLLRPSAPSIVHSLPAPTILYRLLLRVLHGGLSTIGLNWSSEPAAGQLHNMQQDQQPGNEDIDVSTHTHTHTHTKHAPNRYQPSHQAAHSPPLCTLLPAAPPQPALYTDDPQSIDAHITEQEDAIRSDIARHSPLVGDKEPFTALRSEYANNARFTHKVDTGAEQFSHMRRVRGDGSCFYRSYLYSVLEWAILPSQSVSAAQHYTMVEAFVRQFKRSAEDILKEGRYDPVIVDDFYDTTLDLVTLCTQRTLDTAGTTHPTHPAELPHRLPILAQLHAVMNDEHTAQWYVTWMRCLTSAQLQRHPDTYSPYLVDQPSLAAFCQSEVDGINRDADALQILALTSEMGVAVHISYLDGSEGGLRGYVIPEGEERVVSLLYRPGHYDILYERNDKDGAAGAAGSGEANERKEAAA